MSDPKQGIEREVISRELVDGDYKVIITKTLKPGDPGYDDTSGKEDPEDSSKD